MTDITMCVSPAILKITKDNVSIKLCEKRTKCYRYKAKPDINQSYSKFYDGKKCEYFMPIRNLRKSIRK